MLEYEQHIKLPKSLNSTSDKTNDDLEQSTEDEDEGATWGFGILMTKLLLIMVFVFFISCLFHKLKFGFKHLNFNDSLISNLLIMLYTNSSSFNCVKERKNSLRCNSFIGVDWFS